MHSSSDGEEFEVEEAVATEGVALTLLLQPLPRLALTMPAPTIAHPPPPPPIART
jgi:hypothetical protein